VAPIDASQIRVILLDIEGTTTPIDFVYKTLFPYASRKLESFLRERAQEAEIQAIIEELHEQHKEDERHSLQPPAWPDESAESQLQSTVAYSQWLIANDSKCTPLKSLQGKIWQRGFTNGELRGQVFPDVPTAFERWRRQEKTICIYSSGSVLAQQNLFRTTAYGDLTSCIAVFFDTRVGPKTDGESYKKITASFSHAPHQFLFISDAVKEIEAARAAGMQAILCDRDPRTASSPNSDELIHTFDGIFPE
jgi:enolase-phosphatase E1